MRKFPLHLSIAFRSDFGHGVAEATVQTLSACWTGEWTVLRVRRYTSGGTIELADDDLFVLDDDITWLHARGHYWGRPLHVSL